MASQRFHVVFGYIRVEFSGIETGWRWRVRDGGWGMVEFSGRASWVFHEKRSGSFPTKAVKRLFQFPLFESVLNHISLPIYQSITPYFITTPHTHRYTNTHREVYKQLWIQGYFGETQWIVGFLRVVGLRGKSSDRGRNYCGDAIGIFNASKTVAVVGV